MHEIIIYNRYVIHMVTLHDGPIDLILSSMKYMRSRYESIDYFDRLSF